MGKTITWLHFSDLHLCNPKSGWEAKNILEKLGDDLRRLQDKHGLAPDLIFFTGDAVFGHLGENGGKTITEQFKEAAHFFESIQEVFTNNVPIGNFFIVPGNHDVKRTKLLELINNGFKLSLQGKDYTGVEKALNELIKQGGDEWEGFINRLSDYRQFLADNDYTHLLQDSKRLIYAVEREINGVKIGIAGLNSAWSCYQDGEKGKLWLAGHWQIQTLSRKLSSVELKIALMHHPFNWFCKEEDPSIQREMENHFDFFLHGHEHQDWVNAQADGFTRIGAGASYGDSESETGYNMVRLYPEEGRGEVWLRKYDRSGGGWIPRVIANRTDNNGVWPIRFSEERQTSRVQLVIEGNLRNFDKTTQNKLVSILALLLDIDEDLIRILRVMPGSVRVIVELPEDSAQKLIELFDKKSKEIEELTTHFRISAIEELVEIKKPEQPLSIEFVNRLNEMQYITNIYCPPYLLISAPMGYGKTRLIHAIKAQLQEQNWLCIHLELSREKSYTIKKLTYVIFQQLGEEHSENLDLITPEEAGSLVGRYILQKLCETQQRNVLILVDEIESFEEDLAKQFLNQFLLAVKQGLNVVAKSIRLRSIFAGRNISHWKQVGSKIPLELMFLTPFDFPAVYQTVENFSTKSDLDMHPDYKQGFASHLMYFTGGHPGCMVKILSQDFEYSIIMVASKEKEYYETIVMPVIDEIKAHIPDELEEIFDTLSVVRRFNPRLLRWFIDKELIIWPKSEYELENLLLQTHLVSKEGGFLRDDMTQRLLAIHLRGTELDYFVKICEESISFYTSQLEYSTSNRPDIIAVELLFQQIQYLFYKQKCVDKEQLFEHLADIIKTLISERDSRAVVDSFIECLNNDWEFRFTFNYLLREDIYNDEYPFNELMEKINNFRKELQGGDNNG